MFLIYISPSSFVLTTLTGLAGPFPTDEKANTWNSYSVYLPRPVTSLVRVELLAIVTEVSGSEEFLILNSSLNPKSTPWRESAGGSCQDVRTLVEVRAVTLKLVGLWLGAKRESKTSDERVRKLTTVLAPDLIAHNFRTDQADHVSLSLYTLFHDFF